MHRAFCVEYGFHHGSALLLCQFQDFRERARMSSAEPQHDPTMEEILASIRKIISEDQPLSARKAAPGGEQKDSDVLELTEEVPPEPPVIRAAPIDASPIMAEPENHAQASSILSESSRDAIGRAFESLDKASAEYSHFAGEMLETVFARAVQDAVAPSLQQWVNNHETDLMEALKPIIRNWMDEHLPRLVENVLKQELGRAVTEHLRRRLT
jgi:cell pole-organizing protein PopZ